MVTESDQSRAWMRYVLWFAAACHLLWGAFAIALPSQAFEWAGMEAPPYPEVWQYIGTIVGVYGVGYAIAGFDPTRHWPIVLVGLLGKILGPIGFANAAMHGRLPWRLGWTILSNDIIWWVPFALILHAAYRERLNVRRIVSPEVQKMALRARTQYGQSLLDMSQRSPLLLVFLRHSGCMFCREALADLREQRVTIEASGTRIVLIHMSGETDGGRFFRGFGLEDAARVSDPQRNLYRAFGLGRGSYSKLFGPALWWRAFEAAVLQRHGAGRFTGDIFQMPGVFLVFHGEVVRGYQHTTVADRPNYVDLTALGSSFV